MGGANPGRASERPRLSADVCKPVAGWLSTDKLAYRNSAAQNSLRPGEGLSSPESNAPPLLERLPLRPATLADISEHPHAWTECHRRTIRLGPVDRLFRGLARTGRPERPPGCGGSAGAHRRPRARRAGRAGRAARRSWTAGARGCARRARGAGSSRRARRQRRGGCCRASGSSGTSRAGGTARTGGAAKRASLCRSRRRCRRLQ
jgi:hypothetical protein